MKIAMTVNRLVILIVLTAIFIPFIWCGWRLSRPMSTASNPIKKIFALLSAMFLGGLIWVAWKFQSWMPAGRAVHLSSVHMGDYDYQVWQRKNAILTEPFTTGCSSANTAGNGKLSCWIFRMTTVRRSPYEGKNPRLLSFMAALSVGFLMRSNRSSSGTTMTPILFRSRPIRLTLNPPGIGG